MITASFVPTTNIRSYNFNANFISNFNYANNCNRHHSYSIGSSSSSSSSSLSSSCLLSTTEPEMDTTMFLLPDNPLSSPLLIAILALVLLVAAQSFINQMLKGDRGLGAFLKDGSGYNRSGFRANNNSGGDDDGNSDPLPWLKLPRLDFVEVAGQKEMLEASVEEEEQQKAYEELERLRLRLNRELENVSKRRREGNNGGDDSDDDMAEATRLRTKIERLMKLYGIEYETE